MEKNNIHQIGNFLELYTASLIANGAYTSRVDRCVERIAKAFGYEVNLSIFLKHTTLIIVDKQDYSNRKTQFISSLPMSLNFSLVSDLSALSWKIYDQKLSLEKSFQELHIILSNKIFSYVSRLFWISMANMAFCKLFEGDFWALIAVFIATFIGFNFKAILQNFRIDIRVQYVATSFLASFIAYLFGHFHLTSTPDIAIGTSILFLVPGVYLINSIIDIFQENILVGISRAINMGVLIVCMAVGVYLALVISNTSIINV